MMRILAFAGLLALQFALGTCDEGEVHILEEGSILRLRAPDAEGKLIKCSITTSQNISYELHPKNDFPGYYDGREERCSLDARDIPFSYRGVWIMKTETDKGSFETKFTVKMKQKGIPRPTDRISSVEGQWATVWLDSDRDDVTFCNLTNPQWKIHNLMEEKVENLTRVHGCGARILVNNKMTGQWMFSAQYGDFLIKTAVFFIDIPYSQEDPKMIHQTWQLGSTAKLELYDRNMVFCQLTRPDGHVLPLIFGSCSYNTAAVSALHRGIWNATYARNGNMKLLQTKINITITDPKLMEISTTRGDGGEVNILCRTGEINLKFCTFITPNQQAINVPAGLGNGKYAYYGKGYQTRYSSDRDYGECGLTILAPSAEDFGMWSCKMGIDGKVRGIVINVVNTRDTGYITRTDNPKVFVKRGDDFKIQCAVKAILSYCWLTSPNGTTYSVSSSVGGPGNILKYDGKGFAMGDCGAIVKKANDTDMGTWTCHLGIKETTQEVEGTVTVKVTDAYLIATKDTVYAQPKPKLSCRTFGGEEGTLEYCRWIRPNGHGINQEEASRYTMTTGFNECSLTILTLRSEDIGQWKCVALLTRASSDEEWATIDLKAVEDDETRIASILSIVLGSGLLIITLIGALFAGMHLYKRRNARMIKSPPPYYPEDYTIPHGIQTPSPTIQTKEYQY